VALVGYTKCGQVTLMRALKGSEVLVATSSSRRSIPRCAPSIQKPSRRCSVSDTAASSRPAARLVASFKSTL